MPLPWISDDLATDVDNWGFSEKVSGAMKGLTDAGRDLMRPIGQHVAEATESATRRMPAPISQPEISIPDVPRFSLGRVEDWLPRLSRPGPQLGQETPPTADTGFSLPSVDDFLGRSRRGVSGLPGSAGAGVVPRPPSAMGQAGAGPADFNAYVRQAAAQRGLDPEQVAAVMGKEGPSGWDAVGRFETGTSYGPLQLHYAGGSKPTAGMGDDFTRDTGVDLRTDRSLTAHQRAVDYALDRLAKTGDFREWYGADPALGSRFTKVNRIANVAAAPAASPPPGTGPVPTAGRPTPPPKWGTYTGETLAPNQYTEGLAQGLTMDEALAVCGPAAAVAFSRATGRTPTLREAKELAAQSGVWDASVGMRGPASEVALLEKMGVPARLTQGADWDAIRAEVRAGRPVIADTPGHYYVISDAYPDGSFELGQSAAVLKKSGGRTRYRPEQIPGLGMGDVRATIFMR